MLSIITVVKNDINGLEETIKSLKMQAHLDFEHIIVDGGSTDGSAQLAKKNSDVLIDSRNDGGIYFGMQRGLLKAHGEYVMFVNSGDIVLGKELLADAINRIEGANALWGTGPIIEKKLDNTFAFVNISKNLDLKTIAYRLNFIAFPSSIIDRKRLIEIGGMNCNYRIAGDFDLIVRLAQNELPLLWDFPLVLFEAGGISYTHAPLAWKEEHLIRVHRLGLNPAQNVLSACYRIKRLSKWKVGKLIDTISRLLGHNPERGWRKRLQVNVPEKFKPLLDFVS